MKTMDETERKNESSTAGPDWGDPSIPPGNSPPLPAWPLWVSIAAWGAWTTMIVCIALSM